MQDTAGIKNPLPATCWLTKWLFEAIYVGSALLRSSKRAITCGKIRTDYLYCGISQDRIALLPETL